jgi:hypothetical protein
MLQEFENILEDEQPNAINDQEDSSESDDNDTEDSFNEEDSEPVLVTCPCCEAGFTELPPNCEHILIEYDESFREFTCDYFFDELDDLKTGMMDLLEAGKLVTAENPKLQAIWDYAKECHTANPSVVELHTDIFMAFLSEKGEDLGASIAYMNEEEGAPGYSSSYVYYFAADPEGFIQNVTDYILASFKTDQ